MFDRKKGFHPVTIVLLLVFSFLGLLICSLIDTFFYSSDEVNTPSPILPLIIFFGAIWTITLVVIFPIQILYFHRKNRDDKQLQKATIKDFIGLPLGACNPDAKVPKWISIPILGLLWLLIAILGLGLVLGFIAFCIAYIKNAS
ncbi:MAG: hypothetical protein ACW990_19720 [Promethearchaeota archaeon]